MNNMTTHVGYYYIITSELHEAARLYKLGITKRSREDLIIRYQTYLIRPEVKAYIHIANREDFEREMLSMFYDNIPTFHNNGKSEWVRDVPLEQLLEEMNRLRALPKYSLCNYDPFLDMMKIMESYEKTIFGNNLYVDINRFDACFSSIKQCLTFESFIEAIMKTCYIDLKRDLIKVKYIKKGKIVFKDFSYEKFAQFLFEKNIRFRDCRITTLEGHRMPNYLLKWRG